MEVVRLSYHFRNRSGIVERFVGSEDDLVEKRARNVDRFERTVVTRVDQVGKQCGRSLGVTEDSHLKVVTRRLVVGSTGRGRGLLRHG